MGSDPNHPLARHGACEGLVVRPVGPALVSLLLLLTACETTSSFSRLDASLRRPATPELVFYDAPVRLEGGVSLPYAAEGPAAEAPPEPPARSRRGYLAPRDQPVSLPDHAIGLPAHAVTPPGHSVTLPGHSVTLPGRAVARPGHPMGLPGHPLGVPSHAVTPPAPPVDLPAPPVTRTYSAFERPSHPVSRPSAPIERAAPAR